MGDVVNFEEKTNKLKYDNYLLEDCYLRSTALNALNAGGYQLNKNGILQFQYDNNLTPTGVLSVDDLPTLLLYFEPETRQEVMNYLEQKKMNKKDKKLIPMILTLIGILFFELYGIISCFFDILHWIRK